MLLLGFWSGRLGYSQGEDGLQEPKQPSNSNGEPSFDAASEEPTRQKDVPERVSYIQTLKLFNGRKTDEYWYLVVLGCG